MPISLTVRRSALAVAAAVVGASSVLALSSSAHAATFSRLMNEDSGLVLAPASLNERATVVQRKFNSTDLTQQWRQQLNSDGTLTYVLRAKINTTNGLSDGCLDLSSDANRSEQKAGAVVVVRPCDGTTSQKWKRFFVSNGGNAEFNLENRLSLMNLDIDNNKPLSEFSAAIQNDVFRTSQDFIRTGFVTG